LLRAHFRMLQVWHQLLLHHPPTINVCFELLADLLVEISPQYFSIFQFFLFWFVFRYAVVLLLFYLKQGVPKFPLFLHKELLPGYIPAFFLSMEKAAKGSMRLFH